MHKLDRDPTVPGGLTGYRHGRDIWSASSPDQSERTEIWRQLAAMQGWRCAYCEGEITQDSSGKVLGHIEHFRQRDRYPQGTFDWDNLFGSCNRKGTCGDHKDKCGAYDHRVLIKPDIENPEDFLVFLPNGSVRPRARLRPADLRRAEETIRILKLDGTLDQIRKSAVRDYIETAEAFADLALECDESEWMPELQREIAATSHLPFATAIKHVLSNQSA